MATNPVTSSIPTSGTTDTGTISTPGSASSIDSMLMQLLITQLQNQGPLVAHGPSTFVTQLSQVSSLGSAHSDQPVAAEHIGRQYDFFLRRRLMPQFSIPLSGLTASSAAMSTIANNW